MKEKFFYMIPRKLYFWLLSFFNAIIYKRRNKFFFEDLANLKDNHYILFQYMQKNCPEYQLIYFTPNKSIVAKEKNVKIIHNTFLATIHYLTSRVIFYSYGMNRFQCIPQKKQFVVNLWHGMPLKKIGYMLNVHYPYPPEKAFSHLLVSAPFFANAMKTAFNCKEHQIVMLGYPRNDLLFDDSCYSVIKKMLGQKFENTILFLPTFRNAQKIDSKKYSCEFPLLTEKNIFSINQYLQERKTCLVVKLHHAQKKLPLTQIKCSNILFFTNDDLEKFSIPLYALLGFSDALITDYSSVYVDYLIKNRPIAFVLEDYKEYEEKRGFAISNPIQYMPGQHIYNCEDLKTFIDDVYLGKDLFSKKREEVCNLFNIYKDNHNCKRIVEFVNGK